MRTVCGRKTFNKFQTFERCQHFSPYHKKKSASYKVLKEIKAAIASVVGLVYLSSNLQIIILHFRT